MTKKLSVAEKIANQAVRKAGTVASFNELVNKLSDKEVLAVACVNLDKEVVKADFETWRNAGFSRSKRSMRVMHRLLSQMKDPAADAVIHAKHGYLYSVCAKTNKSSTAEYKAIRAKFLPKLDQFLTSIE